MKPIPRENIDRYTNLIFQIDNNELISCRKGQHLSHSNSVQPYAIDDMLYGYKNGRTRFQESESKQQTA